MNNVIAILNRVNAVLGTLDIKSTRSNMDAVLGGMQLLDRAVDELHEMECAHHAEEEADHENTES